MDSHRSTACCLRSADQPPPPHACFILSAPFSVIHSPVGRGDSWRQRQLPDLDLAELDHCFCAQLLQGEMATLVLVILELINRGYAIYFDGDALAAGDDFHGEPLFPGADDVLKDLR